MIDFPNSPTVDQIVEGPNGQQWKWTGATWVMVASATGGGTQSIQVGDPVGTIKAFSGNTIPPDCLVCDGSAVPAGTAYDALRAIVGANVPDLRNRFILGSSATYALRSVGGAATHTLTEGEMPYHTHSFNSNASNTFGVAFLTNAGALVGTGSAGQVKEGYATNGYAGANGPHNNMPPYYAVYFIIQARATNVTISGGGGSGGSGGGSGFTYATDVMPTLNLAHGQTWHDTSTGLSYVYIIDANTPQWVQFAPAISSNYWNSAWGLLCTIDMVANASNSGTGNETAIMYSANFVPVPGRRLKITVQTQLMADNPGVYHLLRVRRGVGIAGVQAGAQGIHIQAGVSYQTPFSFSCIDAATAGITNYSFTIQRTHGTGTMTILGTTNTTTSQFNVEDIGPMVAA